MALGFYIKGQIWLKCCLSWCTNLSGNSRLLGAIVRTLYITAAFRLSIPSGRIVYVRFLFEELSYKTEDVCLLKLLEGMCVRCLNQKDVAELCFTQVLSQ